MAQWIFACKELNGGVYIARLPKALNDFTPGVPDTSSGGPWLFVGPGARPTLQQYSGSQFILTFDYLSHLFTRVIDFGTWPPTQVNPVQVSGGPNPPTPFTYNIQLSQDSLTMKTEGGVAIGGVAAFFNPPVLVQPSLFLDPITDTYSVTLEPISLWVPEVSVGLVVFYRLYNRPFPYTGPWILVTDWTQTSLSQPYFSFLDSHVASLRYQYSVTWGTQWRPNHTLDTTMHAEGNPGDYLVTVDSTRQHAFFQFSLNESLTLELSSATLNLAMGQREQFLDEGPEDDILLSKSLLGAGADALLAVVGERQAFINVGPTVDAFPYPAPDDMLGGPFSLSNPFVGGNALTAHMG